MARPRKNQVAVKDTRPSLDDLKAKQGRYVIASYRGYEQGDVCLPAPDAYALGLPGGYQPKELVIRPWLWEVIPDYWLNDTNFQKAYDRTPGMCVDKTDLVPQSQNLQELPPELERVLSADHKQKAWWIATQPYFDNKSEAGADDPRRGSYALIHMKNMDQSDDSPQQVEFLQEVLAPLLQAAQIYEERLGARPEVLKALEKRLDDIGGKRAYRKNVKGKAKQAVAYPK